MRVACLKTFKISFLFVSFELSRAISVANWPFIELTRIEIFLLYFASCYFLLVQVLANQKLKILYWPWLGLYLHHFARQKYLRGFVSTQANTLMISLLQPNLLLLQYLQYFGRVILTSSIFKFKAWLSQAELNSLDLKFN